MGRSPCCDEASGLKKGPWAVEEDEKLKEHIRENGHRSWRNLPKLAGLNRCGKSCRLRWTNYLRPDIKRGKFTEEEERQIIHLHSVKGNKWSEIARHLPGRTDNEIKNFWNTHLRKKLLRKGIDPITHQPRPDLALLANLPNLLSTLSANPFDHTTTALGLRPNATDLAKLKILQNLLQALIPLNNFTPSPILLPPSTIDPTLIQNLTDQSHLFVNQPPLPLDVDVGYINTLNDQFNDHMDQNMCCNTDPMMNNNNNNNNSCYNNTILSPTTMLPVGDHVDNYNCEDVHARERSSSTASVSGSSTSTEATYNPWISELLWGHFELKDIVDDQYN